MPEEVRGVMETVVVFKADTAGAEDFFGRERGQDQYVWRRGARRSQDELLETLAAATHYHHVS
jgi:hypothetical protein